MDTKEMVNTGAVPADDACMIKSRRSPKPSINTLDQTGGAPFYFCFC